MHVTRPASLINVLRFTAALGEIVDRSAAPAAAPADDAPAAPTTAAEALAAGVPGAQQAAAERALSLYRALITDERAVELVPLIIEREDGSALTRTECESIDADLFWNAWTFFLTRSSVATRAALGFAGATGSPGSATASPTTPT